MLLRSPHARAAGDHFAAGNVALLWTALHVRWVIATARIGLAGTGKSETLKGIGRQIGARVDAVNVFTRTRRGEDSDAAIRTLELLASSATRHGDAFLRRHAVDSLWLETTLR